MRLQNFSTVVLFKQDISTNLTCSWDRRKIRRISIQRSVVLALTECLENTHCTIFLNNFLHSPSLIVKLFDKSIYAARIARKNTKYMPEITANKTIAVCFGATKNPNSLIPSLTSKHTFLTSTNAIFNTTHIYIMHIAFTLFNQNPP